MTTQSRAEAILLATTLIWASTFVVMKIGLEDMSPILMSGVRFVLAAIGLAAAFYKRIFPISRMQFRRGAVLGLFLYLGFIAQNVGLTITTASKSAFITSLMVVFVPIFQYLIERRAPTRGNLMGIAVVLVGLWLLTSPTGSAMNVGDLLTLFCAAVFGYYIVYLDIASKEVPIMQLAFMQIASAGFFSIATALLFEEMKFNLTTQLITGLIYLTIFATVITTYVQTRFQKDTTPTRAAIIFTIEPVWASLFAAVVLGERIGVIGAAGGALIVGGVLLSELSVLIPGLNKPAVSNR